jgi:hypothetical protein
MKDTASMSRWFDTGEYVAEPRGKPKSSGSRRPPKTPSNAWLNNDMPTADSASAR